VEVEESGRVMDFDVGGRLVVGLEELIVRTMYTYIQCGSVLGPRIQKLTSSHINESDHQQRMGHANTHHMLKLAAP